MNIQTNFSLKNYNTFGIDAKAKQFVSINSISELKEVLTKNDDIFILGGGSNMLLTQDIEKLVVHVNLKGREIVEENDDFAIVKAQAGEIGMNLYFGASTKISVESMINSQFHRNFGQYTKVQIRASSHQLELLQWKNHRFLQQFLFLLN